jgi:hypothetical protein
MPPLKSQQPSGHRPVERFAYYFKREFRYDFRQFEAEDPEEYRAWLFASNRLSPEWRAVGAACFRQREYEGDEKACWHYNGFGFIPISEARAALTTLGRYSSERLESRLTSNRLSHTQ